MYFRSKYPSDMNTIKIRKGLDIKLKGRAKPTSQTIEAERYAIMPDDFIGLLPRLLVKEGDKVKVGTPLLCDKHNEKIVITSPASGEVSEIRRGEKRHLQAVVIKSDNAFESDIFSTNDDKDNIINTLTTSGLWAMLRQRPYSVIANPNDKPKAIFISTYDTSPLAPDMDYIVDSQKEAFQKGLDILNILSGKKVHLCNHTNNTSKAFTEAKNVNLHTFEGPHPAGNVGTHINKIMPINKGDIIWYCYPNEVINIGKLFLSGKADFSRTYAVAGSCINNPHYVKTHIGASLNDIIGNETNHDNVRIISGNVLTGHIESADGFMHFYDNMVTAIPEGNDRHEMLGWLAPGIGKFSFSHTFLSGFIPNEVKREYDFDTNMHGEERAYVITGEFEKVFPFDIYPLQLIKACLAEDIDLMENLGILEVDPEDFALCEFIDTSKTDIQNIIRKGIELVRKENE